MSKERPDTGGPSHDEFILDSHGCNETDCTPETACLEDDCCKGDESCDVDNPCDDDHCQSRDVTASAEDVADNASLGSKATTCCGSVERCDEKCIYTAAALECANACDGDDPDQIKHPHEHDATGNHLESACGDHLRAAFDKYRSYIEHAQCICRSIASLGLASSSTCCKPPIYDQGPISASSATPAHATSGNRTKDAFGTQGLSTSYLRPHHHHRRRGHHHHHQDGGASGAVRRRNVKQLNSQNDNLSIHPASHHQDDHDHDHAGESCCTGHNHYDHDQDGHDHDDNDHHGDSHDHGKEPCCTGHSSQVNATKTAGFVQNDDFDVEKSADHDLISVAISGMDCTSCGDKLSRVLLMTPGVSQARVNFIAGRADFTINTTITNADQAIRFAVSGSGFNLTRIVGGDYFLDVMGNPDTAKELIRQPPDGVTDVFVLNKNTIRLAYDPTTVGARVLFNSIADKAQSLAPPCADPQLEIARRRLWDQALKMVLAAAFTIPVLVVSWGHDLTNAKTRGIISAILGTVVQGIAIPEFYRPALSTLFYSHAIEMDMLVVISITVAYLYSIVAFGFQMAGHPLGSSDFFETSTLLITLILLGRLIATFARVKAISSVSVRSIQPTMAMIIGKGGNDEEIDARLLQYGDQFKVLPHSRIPTDGTIVQGVTEVDESMLTGEAMPVLKKAGDPLVAGTVNGDGTVLVQLDRLPGKNTVTDIAQMVDDAANTKPKIQDLADKIAGWFVPVVSGISVIVLASWIAIGLKVLDYSTSKAVLEAVTYFVATLAVACPCALGLAVPMVLVIAGGISARGGVIIKSAETTERARKTTDIIFDKTGTLTENDLTIAEENYFSDNHGKDFAIGIAKALVAGGKHPVSAAVSKHLSAYTDDGNVAANVSDVHVVPGSGIEAKFGDQARILRAGHPRWTNTETHPTIQKLQGGGLTVLVITLDGSPLVMFGLRVQIRPEASRVISQLKARNINVHLVSGDQRIAVIAVANSVGIPEANVAAEYTPSQKRDYVASIMEDASKYVAFCGDGTNDAVAVAQANVGIQIGGGSATSSDVTQTAADAILLNGLEGIPFLLNLSRAAFNRMAFNFVWSAIYNVLAITMASGAWVEFRIPPAYAGLGEFISVLPVIAASMTMFLLTLKQSRTDGALRGA